MLIKVSINVTSFLIKNVIHINVKSFTYSWQRW